MSGTGSINFSTVQFKNTNNDRKIGPQHIGQAKKSVHFKRSLQYP